MSQQIETVKSYLRLLENFSTESSDFEKVLHPDVLQIEYPNLLNKKGQERGLEGMLQGAAVGKKILRSQRIEIKNSFENKQQLVAEAVWTGIVANDLGSLKKDQVIKAFFCMVFEFKDGKIFRQRNYDCFESWS